MSAQERPFIRQRKTLRLVFEDEYEGLVVRMRSLSLGELLEFDRLQDGDVTDTDEVISLLDLAASKLVEWNLTNEDGTPVPRSAEALRAEEPEFVMLLIQTWMRQAMHGLRGARDDAPGESPAPEAGGPMEASEFSRILASASGRLPEGLTTGSTSEPS